jgi:hypothetical protein
MTRGVVAILVALMATCAGLSFLADRLRAQSVANLGEVTAVVDGDRPGTVVVLVERDAAVRAWLVDDEGRAHNYPSSPPVDLGQPQDHHCLRQVCYRVALTTLRVDVSVDGGATYAVAWQVAGDDYQALREAYRGMRDRAAQLSSRSVVVHATTGGHVVFVANGRDGLLMREAQGAWRRLGFPASGEGCCHFRPPARLPSDRPALDMTIYAVAVVVGAILATGGLTMIWRRRWTGVLPVLALAAVAGYGIAVASRFPDFGTFPGKVAGVPLMLGILAVGVALSVWFAARRPHGPSSPGGTPDA